MPKPKKPLPADHPQKRKPSTAARERFLGDIAPRPKRKAAKRKESPRPTATQGTADMIAALTEEGRKRLRESGRFPETTALPCASDGPQTLPAQVDCDWRDAGPWEHVGTFTRTATFANAPKVPAWRHALADCLTYLGGLIARTGNAVGSRIDRWACAVIRR